MDRLYFLLAILSAAFTWNAFFPVYRTARLAIPSFLAGWITAELGLHWIALEMLLTFAIFGSRIGETFLGSAGFAIFVLAWLGKAGAYGWGLAARRTMDGALQAGLGSEHGPTANAGLSPSLGLDVVRLVRPFHMRRPDVVLHRDILYSDHEGVQLRLDVRVPRAPGTNRPMLLQVHGGGWVMGSKDEQGLPLVHHMAARGWVCVSVNYRLSPRATFPDHLVDLKRAVGWMRENGASYGGSPDFIAVTGGSAGGHLSAMVGLTGEDVSYQPGFENVNTRVQACVPVYGVYDMADRRDTWPHGGMAVHLERQVFKVSRSEDPAAYDRASPVTHVHADAPPFFVVHGAMDSLVPAQQARDFVEALRAGSRAPVAYAEVPGGQHAFEIFHSPRSQYMVRGVASFLERVHGRWLMSPGSGDPGALGGNGAKDAVPGPDAR